MRIFLILILLSNFFLIQDGGAFVTGEEAETIEVSIEEYPGASEGGEPLGGLHLALLLVTYVPNLNYSLNKSSTLIQSDSIGHIRLDYLTSISPQAPPIS